MTLQIILKLEIMKKKIIYRFNCYELVNILKHNLFSGHPNYSYPIFKQPCNPYNNLVFSLKDNILIYNNILKYYSKKNKCIPSDIIKFKDSYFNVEKMFNNYKTHFFYRSCSYFINKMSPERFKHELLCYIITNIKTNKKFKNLYCKKCYNSADPILITNIFKKVLILDELNSNFIFIYGKSIDLFLEKYKIFQKSLFCLSSHKKRKK